MRLPSLLVSALAFPLLACAQAPGDGLDPDDLDPGAELPDSGAKRDAGKTTASGSASASPNRDAGVSVSVSSSGGKTDAATASVDPLSGLTGLFGTTSDAGKAAVKSDGGAGKCENLICFDAFDCAIF
ncbi:MAG: hypothetical protein JWN48_3581, partial [Myxococcaceae bacterium]|nr:hypothetical protein [Myxococcaceae bacterium]